MTKWYVVLFKNPFIGTIVKFIHEASQEYEKEWFNIPDKDKLLVSIGSENFITIFELVGIFDKFPPFIISTFPIKTESISGGIFSSHETFIFIK